MSDPRTYPPKAYILCSDQRFARAMAHEIERIGGDPVVRETVPDALPEAAVVLADGDDRSPAVWANLRQETHCPWIFWSREELSLPDAVCLRRPFDLGVLIEVLRSCLTGEWKLLVAPPTGSQAKSAQAVTVLREGVLSVRGEELALTPFEWAVYQCLQQHRGETVSRETLRVVLGGATGNTVDVYVCHLRAKLEKPLGVRLITTVRGQGYRME